MDGCVRACVDDLSNGQAALYKCTSEGTTLNPTDSLPLHQLITLGIAGHLGLGDCRPPTGPGLMSNIQAGAEFRS